MRSTRFLAALIVSATVFNCTFGADLPPGWKHVDVGAPPSPPGDASYDDQTEVYTLAGDGAAGLWMPAADAVHFAYKEWPGDCEIIARVNSIEGGGGSAKAGVMIRDGLDAGGRCAVMALTAANWTVFQHRKNPGEGLWSQDGRDPNMVIPCWIRLVRESGTFTGYYSKDGENWIEQPNLWADPEGNNPARIAMGYTVLIGLFVTSEDSTKRCTAQFDHVKVVAPMGTAMTYRGYLVDQGAALSGPHDLCFTLYDDPNGGRQVGETCDVNGLVVQDGHLTATVFFGGSPDVFNGEARWLEIAVKPSGQPGPYAVLEPRERITPAPYALYATKPIGPQGEQGPPGPKGDMPRHEWKDGRDYLRFENPEGTWGGWVLVRGSQGAKGDISDYKWDSKNGALSFKKNNAWEAPIRLDDQDWIVDGQNVYRPSGFVGVQTKVPAYPLDVAGEASFDGALFARDNTGIGFKDRNGVLGLWVKEGGNVGVGIASPSVTLDIMGDESIVAGNDGIVDIRGTGATTRLTLDNDEIQARTGPQYQVSTLSLNRLGGNVLLATDSGRVGVRTNGPQRELDVAGQGRFDGEIFAADDTGIGFVDRYGALGLWVITGGNVGVAERRPVRRLDVNGQGRFDGEIYARDTTGIGLLDKDGKLGLWVEDGGNVGVGMGDPAVKLEVSGATLIGGNNDGILNVRYTNPAPPHATTRLTLDGGGIQARTGSQYQAAALSLNAFGGDVLLATGGGKVGIGTSTPKVRMAIVDQDTGLDCPADGVLDILSNNSRVVHITKAGRVGIGTTDDPTESLDLTGTARLRGIGTGSGTTVVADASGKLLKQSSSRRYKEDIKSLKTDPYRVLELNPVRFRWRTTGEADIGLVAEEVAGLVQDLVLYDGEGRPDGVKYDRVALYLLAVVKAQQQRIADLEAAEARHRSLEQRVELLERMVRQAQAHGL